MLTVVIQAGGQSRRMGRDKATLPFAGQPLIQRVVDRLAPLADELIVTTNRPETLTFLACRKVADVLPGRGALGGLYTALHVARHPLVAVVACDMPFVSADLLRAAAARLQQECADAAVPRTADGWEPFHAVYRRGTCLPWVQQALDAGQWQVIAWFGQARVLPLEPAWCRRYDPEGVAFWNLNTPDDWIRAQAFVSRRSPCPPT